MYEEPDYSLPKNRMTLDSHQHSSNAMKQATLTFVALMVIFGVFAYLSNYYHSVYSGNGCTHVIDGIAYPCE